MTTMAMNRTNTMNVNAQKAMGSTKMSLMDHFRKYITDNAYYFVCATAACSGNGYIAPQLMRDAREYQMAHNA